MGDSHHREHCGSTRISGSMATLNDRLLHDHFARLNTAYCINASTTSAFSLTSARSSADINPLLHTTVHMLTAAPLHYLGHNSSTHGLQQSAESDQLTLRLPRSADEHLSSSKTQFWQQLSTCTGKCMLFDRHLHQTRSPCSPRPPQPQQTIHGNI